MEGKNNIKFLLEGLDCVNCALKIEDHIKKIEGVESASLNFVTKSLDIKHSHSGEKEIAKKIKDIVKKFEPHVVVRDLSSKNQEKEEEKSGPSRHYLAFLGIVAYGAALILSLPQGISIALFIAAYFAIGGGIVYTAVRNILRGQVFDENFLMTIATLGAFAIGEYPEAVAVMLFYRVGEYFQDKAVDSSRRSIKKLLAIKPDYANLKLGNEITRVSPEVLNIGDTIIVKAGERIPLDCEILSGNSSLDTSPLTGESMPRPVGQGDEVFGGTINLDGLLTLKVIKVFEQSVISKVLDLVENSATKKAKTESFITKFAKVYTPVVVTIALLLAVVPPMIIKEASFSDWFYRALIFLVVSCPCALVVSIPLSFFGGIGAASKKGILVKGGNYLEALNEVEAIVFDKTGTLTRGQFVVSEIVPADGEDKDKLLEYAAMAEVHSNHPIAKSIVRGWGRPIDTNTIKGYKEFPGKGVMVTTRDREILVGNGVLLKEYGIDLGSIGKNGTVVGVVSDRKYLGHIIITDGVKEDSLSAIKGLKELLINKISMVTGDSSEVAQEIGSSLDIPEIYSGLLPHQKVEKLEEIYQATKVKRLAFVGDGINDAPVLARADVGIAMGGLGSDAAVEAADIIIMDDKPSKVVTAIKIARKTKTIVWQNIIFALGVKLLVLVLGAAGIATMWEAVFADVGVALIAVLNSMRTMKVE